MGEVEVDVGRVLNDVAYTFFQAKDYKLAMMQMEVLLEMYPMDRGIRFNAARCCYYAGKYERAMEHIDMAIMIDETNVDYMREKALYLLWLGRQEESWKMLKRLPRDERTKFNMGWHMFGRGEMRLGFQYLEEGRKINCWGTPAVEFESMGLKAPMWDGMASIGGAEVLVINEGGYGDEVLFARFAKSLAAKGARVTMMCSDDLAPVLSRVEGVRSVTNSPKGEYDYLIPSMSLPHLLDIDSVSGAPYLVPDDGYVEKWKSILDLDPDRMNIGMRWQGGPLFEHDQKRTLPAAEMHLILKGTGAKIYSLQKETDDCPEGIVDLQDRLETWEDTVAAISLLDAVFTSCTSVTHVAGALGVPTYVMVPIVPYFVWAEMGNRSKWYDSARVFRQDSPYGWSEAMHLAKEHFLKGE